jgi:hypothetical protein
MSGLELDENLDRSLQAEPIYFSGCGAITVLTVFSFMPSNHVAPAS